MAAQYSHECLRLCDLLEEMAFAAERNDRATIIRLNEYFDKDYVQLFPDHRVVAYASDSLPYILDCARNDFISVFQRNLCTSQKQTERVISSGRRLLSLAKSIINDSAAPSQP